MTSWRTTGCTSKFPAHFPQSRDELWKNRAIICPIKSRGGPGVPPLRIPSASLHSAPSPKREGCGRVRTPAPTEHTKDCPRNAVGADDLGGPRAHTVRPYSGKRPRDVGSETAGAAVEAHHLKFFTKSGPQWGRTGPRSSTPDFARRKFSACPKG